MVGAPSLIDNKDGEKYSLPGKWLDKKFLKFNYAVYWSVVTNCCTAATNDVNPVGLASKPDHTHTWTPPVNALIPEHVVCPDAKEDNKWYPVDITAVLADSALTSRSKLQNISALG